MTVTEKIVEEVFETFDVPESPASLVPAAELPALQWPPTRVSGELPPSLRRYLDAEEAQRRNDEREALLIQLMFAARALAEKRLHPRVCLECGAEFLLGPDVHLPSSRAFRVLDVLRRLEQTAPTAPREGGAR